MKILKKIRERIVSSPKRSDDCYSLSKQLAPVGFHNSVHGDNIKLSSDGLLAKRNQSFCKAIVFSNRALLINEKISIVITSVSSAWSGSLRFGFCNINPTNLKNRLPKYMCPNLTSIQGYYARALQDEETRIGTVLTFWLNEFGQIMYKINGHTQGVFLQIDYHHVNIPMWAMIDVYGLVTSVKIIHTESFVFHNTKPIATRSMTELNNLNLAALNLNEPIFSSPQHHHLNHHNSIGYLTIQQQQTRQQMPVSRYYANVEFNRMQLSETVGANIKLNSSRTIASRKNLTCNLGYVFTKRPLNLNEKLVIQILKNDQLYNGNLGFGLTTCNPINLNSSDLPTDSHKLLDRNEYWVVIKDVLVNAKAGDELGFTINSLNQVQLTKNNLPPVTLMHVDSTQRFYAFFDLHGKTTKVQLLGTYYEANQVQFASTINQNLSQNNHNLTNHHSEWNNHNNHNNQTNGSSIESTQTINAIKIEKLNTLKKNNTSSPKLNNQQIKIINQNYQTSKSPGQLSQETANTNGECTVCFEKQINCVLYQCGHMCMCYDCAMRQWQGVGGGQCPICRAYICDVIRTYWS